MRLGAWMAAAAFALPAPASGVELRASAWGRGWFFGAEGNVRDTDLDALDFDSPRGQPEVGGRLEISRLLRLEASYLAIRRAEEGRARGTILGVLPAEDTVAIDLDVDYLRGHFGFGLLAREGFDAEPFVEVAWIREATDVRNLTTGARRRQEDSAVFPSGGVAFALGPAYPVKLTARVAGIATGRGELLDVEGGLEARGGFFFGGVGYRHIDVRVEDSAGREVADLGLGGVYLQGGVRF